MTLKFAQTMPYSSGTVPTTHAREKEIQRLLPSSFARRVNRIEKSGAVVLLKGKAEKATRFERFCFFVKEQFSPPALDQTVVMRRQTAGYEWRLYHFPDTETLSTEQALKECEAFEALGYNVSVIMMGTKLRSGDSISQPGELPFRIYAKYLADVNTVTKRWLESQADRATVY